MEVKCPACSVFFEMISGGHMNNLIRNGNSYCDCPSCKAPLKIRLGKEKIEVEERKWYGV